MNKVNKLKAINARIKRFGVDVIFGEYYQDENSEIVKYLASQNKKVLVGIQRPDGIYTIIGEYSIYYSTTTNEEYEISHEEFLEIGESYVDFMKKGNKIDFLDIKDSNRVWVCHSGVMLGIAGILVLFRNRVNKDN